MQALFNWTPQCRLVCKKQDPKGFKVPQTTGIMGWIVLTNNCAFWVTNKTIDYLEEFQVDQRIIDNTIFRVEKLNDKFIIADIWLYNSYKIFENTTFEYRYNWLSKLIKFLPNCMHKSNAQIDNNCIKGWEYYSDIPGSMGIFEEYKLLARITRMTLPDCYEVFIADKSVGYLRVPTIEISAYLLTLGDTFKSEVIETESGFFDIK